MDSYVLISVDLEDCRGGSSILRLRVCSWLLGMCLFEHCLCTRVVFPWLRALEELSRKGVGRLYRPIPRPISGRKWQNRVTNYRG